MKLDDALQGVSSLAFDTAPIIYFVEANPAYNELIINDSDISLRDLSGPLCLSGERLFSDLYHRGTKTHRVSQSIYW